MLCGIHDLHPVPYFLDDRRESVLLRKNEKHVLLNAFNRFKVVFEDLRIEGYSDFLIARNKNSEMARLELPSPCFQAMPRTDYRHILGDIGLHELMTSGMSEWYMLPAVDCQRAAN